jgi:hypothetical protein
VAVEVGLIGRMVAAVGAAWESLKSMVTRAG